MKNKNLLYLCTIMLLWLTNTKLFAQVTIPFNAQTFANQFLGWDNTGIANPLNIKTELNQPIHFYTNSGAGTLLNLKMSVLNRTINGTERSAIGIHETLL